MKLVNGLMTLTVVTALSTSALGQCPGEGDCCLGNGTPGCDDAACCEAVCLLDEFCCEQDWDEGCAALAQETCDGCAVAGLVASMDIKPGSCPNTWNPRSRGKLTVALVGTDGFDVTLVDLESLRLGRADGMGETVAPLTAPRGAAPKFKDAATPFEGDECACHDLEADGTIDLRLRFRSRDLAEAMQLDAPHGTMVELTLTGQLTDGTPFEARDCVRVVGGRNRNKARARR